MSAWAAPWRRRRRSRRRWRPRRPSRPRPIPATACSLSLGMDGSVYAVLPYQGKVYIGGDFSVIGPQTGGGAEVAPDSGQVLPGSSIVQGGSVRASVSDGQGGWYIGGSFSQAESPVSPCRTWRTSLPSGSFWIRAGRPTSTQRSTPCCSRMASSTWAAATSARLRAPMAASPATAWRPSTPPGMSPLLTPSWMVGVQALAYGEWAPLCGWLVRQRQRRHGPRGGQPELCRLRSSERGLSLPGPG